MYIGFIDYSMVHTRIFCILFLLLLSKCLQKLLISGIDYPELLSLIRFKIYCLNTRHFMPFHALSSKIIHK